jgi:hypothetical protein
MGFEQGVVLFLAAELMCQQNVGHSEVASGHELPVSQPTIQPIESGVSLLGQAAFLPDRWPADGGDLERLEECRRHRHGAERSKAPLENLLLFRRIL